MISSSRGFNIQQRTISGELFAALGIPVLAGRRSTIATTPACRACGGQRQLRPAGVSGPAASTASSDSGSPRSGGSMEIVGVVGDVALDVYGKKALTSITRTRSSRPTGTGRSRRSWPRLPPEQMLEPVRAAVARLDPELAVHRPAAMEDVVGRGRSRASVRARPDGSVCDGGADARRPRPLRCARLRRSPARAGDRHPHRPGRHRVRRFARWS